MEPHKLEVQKKENIRTANFKILVKMEELISADLTFIRNPENIKAAQERLAQVRNEIADRLYGYNLYAAEAVKVEGENPEQVVAMLDKLGAQDAG